MSSVHLLSAAEAGPQGHQSAWLDLELMRDSARADRFGAHRLVDDPAAADLILFVEFSWLAGYYFERVRSHPVYREFGPRCYLFAATDKIVPFLPGVYASIERRWCLPAWTRSGFYLGVREEGAFRYEPSGSPRYLFSFLGAAGNHPLRRRVLALRHPDASLVDSQGGRPDVTPDRDHPDYAPRYVEGIRDSAFVLCPRGGGTSSFRLFEAMMLGRVPVIVSDQWVPPTGPDWDAFSIRVPEAEVEAIPALLEARAGEAAAMGEAARSAWVEWFSREAAFNSTVEWCLELQRAAPERAGLPRYRPHLQMLRPYHAARSLGKRLGHGRDAEP